MVRAAYSSSAMLSATETRKASVQGRFLKPSTKRSDVVKPTSNMPPRMRSAHAISKRISARPTPALASPHDPIDRQHDCPGALHRLHPAAGRGGAGGDVDPWRLGARD